MSTTKELIEIIIELKQDLMSKNAIISKLQDYIYENELNHDEDKISYRVYDKLVEENAELKDRYRRVKENYDFIVKLDEEARRERYDVKPEWIHREDNMSVQHGVNFEYDTGHVVPRLKDDEWG
jgi:DNA-binding Lrp family transcriptional regulator